MDKIAPKSSHRALSPEALELVASRFRVLGEANRLRLIQSLSGEERCVGELTGLTGLTQANVSRHLQTLTAAGILKRRKEGLNVYYSVADPEIFVLCEHVCGSLEQRIESHARAFSGRREAA
jgi:ArsR family transcriptional regulator